MTPTFITKLRYPNGDNHFHTGTSIRMTLFDGKPTVETPASPRVMANLATGMAAVRFDPYDRAVGVAFDLPSLCVQHPMVIGAEEDQVVRIIECALRAR